MSKTLGYVILEWDEKIQEYKPINREARNYIALWCYSKSVGEYYVTKLNIAFPSVKFILAKVSV